MRKTVILFALLGLVAVCPAAQAAFPVSSQQELLYQATFGRADDIKILFTRGEKPSFRNGDNVPIVSIASSRRDAEGLNVVRAIIEAGADVNAEDSQKQTPLFYAARKGNVEMTRLLLDLGAKYDHIDMRGDTARNIAFSQGYNEVVATIDKFILEQNEKMLAEYRKYYEAVERNNELLAERQETEERIVDKQKKMLEAKSQLEFAKQMSEQERRAALMAATNWSIEQQKILELQQQQLIAQQQMEQQRTAAALAEANAEREKAAAAAAEEAQEKSEADAKASAEKKAQAEEKARKEKEAAELAIKRDPKRLRGIIYDLSYNTCARQYWHYCNDVGMETDFESRELAERMADHEAKLLEASKLLVQDFDAGDEYIHNISDPSQSWLLEQLDGMYSNRYRKENGVGTEADMKKRCERIAASFMLQPGSSSVRHGNN